jgi:hypothetical protein
MLVIRPEQFDVFERTARKQFEDLMVSHLREFHPAHAAAAGEVGLRRLIRAGMGRAAQYGFTLRGPVRFYLELMMLYGHEYDTDPLLPWAGRELGARGEVELTRADRMHATALAYHAAVVGAGGEIEQRAIRQLLRDPVGVWLSQDLSDSGVEAVLRAGYPEKCSAAEPAAVREVVALGRRQAGEYGLPDSAGGLVFAALALALGHGCVRDPVYPWIAENLRETDGQPTGRRVEKLATRAMAFLSAVLAEHERG